MCYFLSIGIPTKHSDWAVEILSKDFEMWEMKNPSFLDRLSPNENAYTVTTMGCSCTFYFYVDIKEYIEQEKARRRRKGWSEAKIKRSIEQKFNGAQTGFQGDFLKKLATLFAKIDRLTLAVHWYDDDCDKEHVQFTDESRLTINELLENPAMIKPDIIYRVR